jgi:hypothetical protein
MWTFQEWLMALWNHKWDCYTRLVLTIVAFHSIWSYSFHLGGHFEWLLVFRSGMSSIMIGFLASLVLKRPIFHLHGSNRHDCMVDCWNLLQYPIIDLWFSNGLLEVAYECSSYKIHYVRVELAKHVHGSLANIWHLKPVQYMELGFPCVIVELHRIVE